ncbi:MAG: hypothetical protein HY869_17060 [Chloroflexi bacterium]|nr:hypothetical protein [Chloroflexota bacterium]
MQQDYANSMLRSGILEAKTGARGVARRYLERALYSSNNASHDTMAEAWYWMAMVTDEPAEKRKALENALSHDLRHARARRELAILDGKLKPEDLVDPNALPAPKAGTVHADADRFMCPKCGGRMSFAPDGQSLVCEYCTRNETLGATQAETEEEDFILAMSTLRGHGQPLSQQVFHCDGCGAEFTLPPTLISATCLYCGSAHVVSLEHVRDLVAPDAVLPHAFHQKHAARYLIQWVEKHKIKPEAKVELPRGLYLPIWTFDLGGVISYTAERVEKEDNPFNKHQYRTVRFTDEYPISVNDQPIPATRKLSQPLTRLLPTFDLTAAKPYDPRYLADWPAEVYDVTMGDASLDARGQAFKRMKADLPNLLGTISLISSSSAGMAVESFKLVLLPIWMTEVRQEGKDHLVLINGQNGAVDGATLEKKTGLFDWLSDVLDDD